MRHFRRLVFCLGAAASLLLAACVLTPKSANSEPITALINGTLIDGSGAEPVPDAVVLLQNGKVLAAGTKQAVAVPADAKVIDVKGGSILPGFINTHVHFGYNTINLIGWAKGGITTVRDEGTEATQLAEMLISREKTNADPKYARVVSMGSMITVPNGYGRLYITSPSDAVEKVNHELDQGVDGIKISLEDGYAGKHNLPKLTPEEMKAIVETAHARHARVSGHITQAAYIPAMLDAGVDDIAHNAYDPIPASTLQRMVSQGVYMIPTFTIFRNFGADVSTCVKNLRAYIQAGGKVALGNDYSGGPDPFEIGIPMFEIEQMTKAGMTPMQIIQAGTSSAAIVIGLEDEVGTLTPGKAADVLVVFGDPLKDLSTLAKPKMVIHHGVVIFSRKK